MKTVNFSDARNNLREVLDRVIDDADVTIITRRDAEDVVVMPLSTWNSWKETEYLMSSPANAKRLLKSLADLNAGRGVHRELVEPWSSEVHEPGAVYRVRRKAAKKSPANGRGKRG